MRNLQPTPSKVLTYAVLLALLPVLVTFDSVIYLLTRPTCLNCGSLVEFIRQGSSLTVFMASVIGLRAKT